MIELNPVSQEILRAASVTGRLPIVRFELRSSRDRALKSTALNHVWIKSAGDTMDMVKERSAALEQLAAAGLVELCYSLFVTAACDYAHYAQSSLYQMLCDMAQQAKDRPGFLFDTPAIKRGEARLTPKGKRLIRE